MAACRGIGTNLAFGNSSFLLALRIRSIGIGPSSRLGFRLPSKNPDATIKGLFQIAVEDIQPQKLTAITKKKMSSMKSQRMSRHVSQTTNWLMRDAHLVKRPGALKKILEAEKRLGGVGTYEYTITVRVCNKDETKLKPRTFKQLTKQLFDESYALQPQHFFFYSEFKDALEEVDLPENLNDQDFLCVVEVEEVEAENALRVKAMGSNSCVDLVEDIIIADMQMALKRLEYRCARTAYEPKQLGPTVSVASRAHLMLTQQPWKPTKSKAFYQMKLTLRQYVFCHDILQEIVYCLRSIKSEPRFSFPYCVNRDKSTGFDVADQLFGSFEEVEPLTKDNAQRVITVTEAEPGSDYSFVWKGVGAWGEEAAYSIFLQLYHKVVDRLLVACSKLDQDPTSITATLELTGSDVTHCKQLVIPPVKIVQ